MTLSGVAVAVSARRLPAGDARRRGGTRRGGARWLAGCKQRGGPVLRPRHLRLRAGRPGAGPRRRSCARRASRLQARRQRAPGCPVEAVHRDLFRNPLRAEELAGFDGVLLDPPRAGAREQVEQLAASSVGTRRLHQLQPVELGARRQGAGRRRAIALAEVAPGRPVPLVDPCRTGQPVCPRERLGSARATTPGGPRPNRRGRRSRRSRAARRRGPSRPGTPVRSGLRRRRGSPFGREIPPRPCAMSPARRSAPGCAALPANSPPTSLRRSTPPVSRRKTSRGFLSFLQVARADRLGRGRRVGGVVFEGPRIGQDERVGPSAAGQHQRAGGVAIAESDDAGQAGARASRRL